MAALTPFDPRFQPGFEATDTSIAAAIGLYGYYGALGGVEHPPTTPLAYVNRTAPPFLIVHGDHDTCVPAEGAREFAARLRTASHNHVVYAELPGAQHAFDLAHSIRFDTIVSAIELFASWVRTETMIRP
jgi:acetyl esterase/lipase